MADNPSFRRHPHPFSIDLVRWLPSSATSPSGRLLAAAVHDPSAASSYIHLLPSPTHPPPLASLPLPSRATALRCSPSALAATTSTGSLHLAPLSSFDAGAAVAVSGGAGFHVGSVRGLDCGGVEWVTAGEDGRVHVIGGGGDGRVVARRVWDGKGMAGYEAAKWASPAEFATGGAGCGVQWWDQRKGDAPVTQCSGIWGRGLVAGMVHSIDIHPSRKHICVVGGSSGTIFAWDLRWPQQPIPLSARILPVMICSEDGILAVVGQGDERPLELLAEPCAINSFDIDTQNPSDVVCALEWESIGVLTRGRDAMAEE
ncbi:hypothetical protein PR202_gb23832 [Eleusine coracana subsp. coracana]|uniref:Uncharacterized protein n=1 Tax=Eleusine coracana subsp. coracana TaxID=191504 RepID=A0AAV5FHA8_ELECO|nr:hypothetical protein PR202_gb23832 [Eleusine coracana subsp. coracana]